MQNMPICMCHKNQVNLTSGSFFVNPDDHLLKLQLLGRNNYETYKDTHK